jgi:two-component system LytT family response regulator
MQPEIKAIIIDDEPKAIDILQQRLHILFPDIEITGTYTEWRKGYEALRLSPPQLLFLDISMPEKNGVELLKLFPSIRFQVIFITAHSGFAVEAIKFSAAGYVLKPIDDYELSFAVNKATDRIREKSADIPAAMPPATNNALKIGIPNAKGIDYLNADNILYFESINKYTKVVTRDYSILSSYNLGEFKKIVDDRVFFQVHRSYIVNLKHIKRYETSGMLTMEDNMQIPVAKGIRTDFMSAFSKISRTAGLKNKETE